MGRKPTVWKNLPRGMRARPRGTKIFYYLDTGGKPRKEIPLGSEYVIAVQKWAELTAAKMPKTGRFMYSHMRDAYKKEVLPGKGLRTQLDNLKEIIWLDRFFGDPSAPLDEIEPAHIKQYKRWRLVEAKKPLEEKNAQRRKKKLPEVPIPHDYGHVRANRELALFSHMWNFALDEGGMTSKPNPCAGIGKYAETGRDVAPDAHLVEKVLAVADAPLAFAIRLADIVGQRPADVRTASESQIKDGYLHIKQGKTSQKLRISIEGALSDLLEEIHAYKSQIQKETGLYAMALLVNEKGQPLSKDTLRSRFDKARESAGVAKDSFQFRDLRAKAATDTDEASGTQAAQALLGHTTEAMTANYIRRKVGRKVRPIR